MAALHWAAARGNIKLVRWLLHNGAYESIHVKNRMGCTPLDMAHIFGPHPEVFCLYCSIKRPFLSDHNHSYPQVEGELGAVLLDPDFVSQLAASQGRQMLRTQTLIPNDSTRETKSIDDEEQFLTTPVHDMRAPELTSRIGFTETERAAAEADNKSSVANEEEKPSWEEVMQSAAEGSSLLLPQVTGDLVPASQSEHSHVEIRAADDVASLINDLRKSVKRGMNEAISEASMVQHSRMDLLDTKAESRMDSFGASLDSFGASLEAHGSRLGDIERTMKRVELMLLQQREGRDVDA